MKKNMKKMKKSIQTAIPHTSNRKNSPFSQAYKKHIDNNRLAPPLVANPNDRKKNTFGVIYVGAQPSINNGRDDQNSSNTQTGIIRVVGRKIPDSIKPMTGILRMIQKTK